MSIWNLWPEQLKQRLAEPRCYDLQSAGECCERTEEDKDSFGMSPVKLKSLGRGRFIATALTFVFYRVENVPLHFLSDSGHDWHDNSVSKLFVCLCVGDGNLEVGASGRIKPHKSRAFSRC